MIHSLAQTLFLSLLVLFSLLFVRRIVRWRRRLREVAKTMPAIPVLFPPTSVFRSLWPQKWQTYHSNWHTQYRRKMYQSLNSDIFALISLFEYDKIFVCDPHAATEMKVTNAARYPKDVRQFKMVFLFGAGLT